MNFTGGASKSMAEAVGFETPSIGKIKRENVKELNFNNATILKDKMLKDLSENKSPAYQEKYIKTLSDKFGYNVEDVKNYAKTISENKKMLDESMSILNQTEKPINPNVYQPERLDASGQPVRTFQVGEPQNQAPPQQELPKEKVVDASYKAGVALLNLDNPDDAIAMFNTALGNLTPESEQTERKILVQGDARDIETKYNPANNPAHSLNGLGNAYIKKGEYNRALEYYGQVLEYYNYKSPKAEEGEGESKYVASEQGDNTALSAALDGIALAEYKMGNKVASQKAVIEGNNIKRQNAKGVAQVTQIEEEATDLNEKQRRSEEVGDIHDMLEAFVSGYDPENKLGTIGYLNAPMKWVSGIQQGVTTIGDGIGEMYEAELANLKGDKTKSIISGLLTTLEGAASTAFAAIPQITAFNAAISGIKDSAKLLPKDGEDAVNSLVDMPFEIVTLASKSLGYNPDEKSDAAKLLRIGDIIASFKTMSILHHGSKSLANVELFKDVKSMKDLQEIAKRVAEKGDPKEIQQVNEYVEYLKSLKLDDIKKAVEESGDKDIADKIEGVMDGAKPAHDELHTKLAELQAKVAEESFGELPVSVQTGILKDIELTQNEISFKENERLDALRHEAGKEAKLAEIDLEIEQATASLEGQPESVKASIQKTIDELNVKRNEISPKTELTPKEIKGYKVVSEEQKAPSGERVFKVIDENGQERFLTSDGKELAVKKEKSKVVEPEKEPISPEESEAQRQADLEAEKQDVIEFKIKEAIEEGDLIEGGVEEQLARESLSKKYDNAEDLRKDSEAMYQMDEADMVEFLVDGKTYKTSKNEYTIKKEGSELTILDKNGREPSVNTRLKIIKDYEDKFDYSKGESAFEGIKEGELIESEADKLVAEKSENPAEIIEAHERLISEKPFEKGDATDNAISENIGKVKQKGRGGYNNFGDKNNVTMNKAKAYFSESKGETIDTLAQRISEDTGLDVTPDDIISFIDRHPNGISDYTKSLKNPLITSLKDRFKQITGLTLNDRVLKANAKKTLSKEDYELISKDYENREQAHREFYDAVERGEADIPREVSDVVEVEAGESKKTSTKIVEDVSPPKTPTIEIVDNIPYKEGEVITISKIHETATSKIDSNELTGKKKDKSLLNRLHEADIPQEGKDAIKGKGLEYTELSNETAKGVADGIIEDYKATYGENWVEPLVAFASQKQAGIPLSINAIALGRVTEHFTKLEKGTDVMSEKLAYAEKAAEVADIMDTLGRDFGRFNSAIQEVYKMTELGVKARMKRKIDNQNNANFDKAGFKGDKSNREKVKQAYDEFNKLKDSLTEEIDKKVSEKMDEIMEQLPKEKKSYAKKAVDAMDQLEKDLMSGKITFGSVIPPIVLVPIIRAAKLLVKGGMKLSEAIDVAIEKYKAENKDNDFDFEKSKGGITSYAEKLGIKDAKEEKTTQEKQQESLSIFELVKKAQEEFEPIKPKEAKIKEQLEKEAKNKALTSGAKGIDISKTTQEKQVEILDKLFPKKRMESASKRKKMHEKIIEANEAGALTYEKFEKLFYEKFGLIDVDSGVVKEFLDKQAERIHNAADGGLKEREYTKVLDFLENHRKQGLTEWFTTPFYANILSGYETHMNNSQFNMFSGIAQTAMLMAKNPRHAKFIATKMLSSFAQSSIEAKNVMLTGERFGMEASTSSLAERRAKQGLGISAYYKIPGRLLKAADVLFNTPLKRMKEAELMLRIANESNKLLPKDQQKTRKEIEADINDIMFDTTGRKAEALEQAKKDIIKLEGKDVDFNDKRISRDVKLRTFEIMERTRPEDKYLQYGIDYNSVKEQAQDFANRGILMTKPVGSLGAVSTFLHNIGDGVPLTKFAITTFVDVPLNLANMMIDKSPLGLVRMGVYEATGKRGLFTTDSYATKNKIKTELTPDQRREAWQRASAYSAGLVALGALTTMEYTDDKGKKRKVLEVTGDGYGDYKKNLQLKSATGGEYKEYTADFMGLEFSYKYNSVLAPILTPLGAVMDYEKYKDKTPEAGMDVTSKVAFGFLSYMEFIGNQANLQGFRDIFGASSRNIDPEKMGAKELDKFQKFMTKTIRSMLVPNFMIQGNKDVKGLMDKAEKMPTEWYHYAVKDVPFVESIMEARYDHYGREVKSQFHLPIVLVPDKLNLASQDPYYKMDLAHKYHPSYVSRRTVFDGEKEVELTQEQLRIVNKRRGEIVLQKLSSPVKLEGELFDKFISNVPDKKVAVLEKLRGKTYMQILDEMDSDAYAQTKNEMFKAAEIEAKSELLGFDVEQKAEDRKEGNKDKAAEKKFLTKALLKLSPKKQ